MRKAEKFAIHLQQAGAKNSVYIFFIPFGAYSTMVFTEISIVGMWIIEICKEMSVSILSNQAMKERFVQMKK